MLCNADIGHCQAMSVLRMTKGHVHGVAMRVGVYICTGSVLEMPLHFRIYPMACYIEVSLCVVLIQPASMDAEGSSWVVLPVPQVRV